MLKTLGTVRVFKKTITNQVGISVSLYLYLPIYIEHVSVGHSYALLCEISECFYIGLFVRFVLICMMHLKIFIHCPGWCGSVD